MPLFHVVLGEHPKQLKNLEDAIQDKLSDGAQYIVKFYLNNPKPDESDAFIIRGEYGSIIRLMVKLTNEYSNFKIEYPAKPIGPRWAEVSLDVDA